MRTLYIHAAADVGRDLGGKQCVPVTLVISEPFPDAEVLSKADPLKAANQLHTENAEKLVAALRESLPQGTLHKVTWMLLKEYSCLLRGRAD